MVCFLFKCGNCHDRIAEHVRFPYGALVASLQHTPLAKLLFRRYSTLFSSGLFHGLTWTVEQNKTWGLAKSYEKPQWNVLFCISSDKWKSEETIITYLKVVWCAFHRKGMRNLHFARIKISKHSSLSFKTSAIVYCQFIKLSDWRLLLTIVRGERGTHEKMVCNNMQPQPETKH